MNGCSQPLIVLTTIVLIIFGIIFGIVCDVLRKSACISPDLVAASNGPHKFNCTVDHVTIDNVATFQLTEPGNCVRSWQQTGVPEHAHECWGIHYNPCDGALSMIHGLAQSSYCDTLTVLSLIGLFGGYILGLFVVGGVICWGAREEASRQKRQYGAIA